MQDSLKEFNKFRTEMNDLILEEGDLNTKRFFNLDHKVYQDGKLPAKTKELLGLVSSLVLRCDDCIRYHIIEADKAGWSRGEIYEAMNVALIVGGSIIIPHMRRAAKLLEELKSDKRKENMSALEQEESADES
ncbi:MAG: carboxymuconolactone decarboxylase family protein, partial [Halanaerobiales bacterium]|nr:carboxymuconolactone decarboxylase family protein [Halanaerobiales bacterium]